MSTRPAGDFVVYGCESCGKRIFTDRSHTGMRGVCPVCGDEHTVGGTPTVYAQEGIERRDAQRVRADHARVEVSEASTLSKGALLPVRDLSETGIAFQLPGVKDPRFLTGSRPPDLKVGQSLKLTLHTRELLRPRTYKVEVRRVIGEDGTYTIGLQFAGLTPEQEAEVRALVRRISQETP